MHRSFAPTAREKTVEGRKVWEVDCRPWREKMRELGHPLRRRFPHQALAQQWIERLHVEVATGRRQDLDTEVQTLSERYLLSIRKSSRADATYTTYKTRVTTFTQFCEAAGIKFVSQVSPAMVEQYRMELHDTQSAHGGHSCMSVLRSMFRWAVSRGYVEFNPVEGQVPPKPKDRRRALTEEERRKILQESDPRWRAIWEIFLLTGLRRREAAELTCEDAVVDSPAPHLRVHGKGGKDRIVPLNRRAIEIVREFRKRARDRGRQRLSPLGYEQLGVRWAAERERMGIDDEITLHCFRHDFATRLVNRTPVPLTEAAAVLGHASVQQTERYVHRDESQLRAAMEALDVVGEEVVDKGEQTGENVKESVRGEEAVS